MASVVFFRAVNVAGYQTFRPGVLARELAELGVVNVGAAGTFLVREKINDAAFRAEILRRLPFKPELMICSGREVLSVLEHAAFAKVAPMIQRFFTILQKPPRPLPRLPHDQPVSGQWQVRLAAIDGRFALCLRRMDLRGKFYPNAVVEKLCGIPATTRNWNTIATVGKLLASK